MVDEQLIARGIEDPLVLDAFLKVPRHCFIPQEQLHHVYSDGPVPIGYDQTISQPYIVAYMLEKLRLSPNQSVLDVGMGSGYQAAILAFMGCRVFGVELIANLVKQAKQNFKCADVESVHCCCKNGFDGWSLYAPYDSIVVAANCTSVPEPLLHQLKNFGKLILPLSYNQDANQRIVLIENQNGHFDLKNLISVRFVPFHYPDETNRNK